MFAKALVISSLLVVALAAPSARAETIESEEDASYSTPAVSIIRLVAACSEFEGHQVMTTGFALFEFENFKICPSTELARVDPSSCFWLRSGEDGISDDQLRSLKDESRAFVTIEARVGCSKHLYAGYLDQIQLIIELETGQVLWSTEPTMRAVEVPPFP